MSRLRAALVLAASTFFAAPVQAQTQPVAGDPTAHRHLGLLLRLDLGLGYLSSSSDAVTVKGAGGEFGLVLGGAVSENLILGGHLWGTTSFSPQVNGVSTSDTSNTLGGIGLNLTYYLMPANVYLSVSPSLTRLTARRSGVDFSSDAGFGMHFAVGKEWWVGDHWGIGVAGQFMFSSNKDQGGGPTISSLAGAIAFSATYN